MKNNTHNPLAPTNYATPLNGLFTAIAAAVKNAPESNRVAVRAAYALAVAAGNLADAEAVLAPVARLPKAIRPVALGNGAYAQLLAESVLSAGYNR